MTLFDKPKAWLAVATIALFPAGVSAQDLTLRISGENPLSGLDLQMAQRFAENLKDELGDAFSYELFHTQALGNEDLHMQMIRTGQIDVYPMGSDAVTLDDKWAIFDMPFLISDRETVARLLDGDIGEALRESMRDSARLEVLAFGENGFRHITNNVRPINVPEDLSGVQIRVPGSPARILTFRSLGAQPISMNMGELYLGLQQGTVDGQENPLPQIVNRSFFEVQNYLSLSAHVYTPTTLVMNGAKFNSLSSEHQDAVRRAAAEAAVWTREMGREAESELLARLDGEIEINEIDLEAFRAAALPIWDEIGKMAGADFAATVVAAASE